MAVSEAQNKARNKWDKEHLKNGSYKMPIELYMQFEKYCAENDISKNAMINRCIADAIGYTASIGKDAE